MKFVDGIKKEYFYKKEGYELLYPNKEQEDKIKQIILEQGELFLKNEVAPMVLVRYILEELSSFSSEIKDLTNEEINNVLENPDIEMSRFCDAIEELINFYAERVCKDNERKYKEALNMIDGISKVAERSVSEKEAIKKMVKLAKLNGAKITNKEIENKTFEEVMKIIEEKLNKKGNK